MSAEMEHRFPPERLVIATLAERPELRDKVFEPEILSAVPEFMRHDPTATVTAASITISNTGWWLSIRPSRTGRLRAPSAYRSCSATAGRNGRRCPIAAGIK